MKFVHWFSAVLVVAIVGCGSSGSDRTAQDGGGGSSGTVGTGGNGASGAGNGGTTGSGGGAACHSDADCDRQSSYYCAAPGESVGCGICPSPDIFPTCSSDADCNPDGGGTQICIGACGGACLEKMCAPGCINDTPCPEGTHCGATHRCEALSCTNGADCPPNFDCMSSYCQRRVCQSDAACQGFCVTGYCYEEIGQCVQPRG